jgi:penicillin amidase
LNKRFKKNKKFDVVDSVKLLRDVTDSYVEIVLPKLIRILERNKYNNQYLNSLKNFDYKFRKNSTDATIYAVLEYNLAVHLLLKNNDTIVYGYENKDDARGILNIFTFWNFLQDLISKVEKGEKIDISNCKYFNENSTCEQFILNVFDNIDTYIQEYKDTNGNILQYGEVHFNYYPHAFDSHNVLKKIFSRRIGTGGTRNTVKVSKNKFNDIVNGPFVSSHSANFKYICDLDDITRPWVSIDTGNSGNFLSKYYDNLMNSHENNQLVKIKNHIFNDDMNLLISFPEHNTLIIRNK